MEAARRVNGLMDSGCYSTVSESYCALSHLEDVSFTPCFTLSMRGRTAHGVRIVKSAFHSRYILAPQCPDRDMDRPIRAKGQKTGAVICRMGGKY
jgi:hypothetical protein